MRRVLAFDIGASNGRAMLGQLSDGDLIIDELYRFDNQPISTNGHLRWDTEYLYKQILVGLSVCVQKGYSDISALAVDTWGVDYGLLTLDGNLLDNPVHYRDTRTDGIMTYTEQFVPLSTLFKESGMQNIFYNTSFQLMSMIRDHDPSLNQADTLLMMPDLIGYFLTGRKVAEYTIASTTQLLNPFTHSWNTQLLEKLGIPDHILPPVIASGSIIGDLKQEIAQSVGLSKSIPVIATAGHDTASAVAAVPFDNSGDSIYISCGTWSLLGTELDQPLINDAVLAANYSNEGGVGGKIKFLTSIAGLWLLQESKHEWSMQGHEYTYSQLEDLAYQNRDFHSLVEPNDPIFIPVGDIPARITDYCQDTGQTIPNSIGQITWCILRSLAFKYRYTLEMLERILKKKLATIHIVGGGAHNRLLAQLTSDITKRKVIAGPSEATITGNILVQFIALGVLPSIAAGRELVRCQGVTQVYEPQKMSMPSMADLEQDYARFCTLAKRLEHTHHDKKST